MSADFAAVVVGGAVAAAASAALKVNVEVQVFSAASALWCVSMSPKMACYMPTFKVHFDILFKHFY